MTSFYRKYRPTDFDSVIDQDHIISVLKKQIEEDEIGHAYLFCGPRGTGKTTSARIFAKQINNIPYERDSLDIVEIDAASNRGIEEIRSIKEAVNFVPSELKYKVYIVDEVHMLTKEAFNALLKTIEEPPEHVVFIFATTEPHKLPQTILSRVLKFDFTLADKESLIKKVKDILAKERVEFEEEALEQIILLGRGSFRDTESVLEKVVSSLEGKDMLSLELVLSTFGLESNDLVTQIANEVEDGSFESAGIKVVSVSSSTGSYPQFVLQVVSGLEQRLKSLISDEKPNYKAIGNLSKVITLLDECLSMDNKNIDLDTRIASRIFGFVGISRDSRQVVAKQKQVSAKVVSDKKEKQKPQQKTPQKPLGTKSVNKEVQVEVEKVVKEEKEMELVEEQVDSVKVEFKELSGLDLKSVETDIKRHEYSNHHLRAIFASMFVKSCSDGVLCLSVPYSFHKKRIETKDVITVIINEYGPKYGFAEIDIIVEAGKTNTADNVGNVEIGLNDDNSNLVDDAFSI